MTKLNKDTFYEILNDIKRIEGKKLKIRVYKGKDYGKDGVKGYYRNWNLVIFTGENSEAVVDWKTNIQVLAHEYMHHLIERAADKEYTRNVDIANTLLYTSKDIPQEQRDWAGSVVMLDEYTTDALAFDILIKKWGLQKQYKGWWWYDANVYNVKIKMFMTTGTLFIQDDYATLRLPVPKKRLTAKQVLAKLDKKVLARVDKLLKSKRLKLVFKNFKSV